MEHISALTHKKSRPDAGAPGRQVSDGTAPYGRRTEPPEPRANTPICAGRAPNLRGWAKGKEAGRLAAKQAAPEFREETSESRPTRASRPDPARARSELGEFMPPSRRSRTAARKASARGRSRPLPGDAPPGPRCPRASSRARSPRSWSGCRSIGRLRHAPLQLRIICLEIVQGDEDWRVAISGDGQNAVPI